MNFMGKKKQRKESQNRKGGVVSTSNVTILDEQKLIHAIVEAYQIIDAKKKLDNEVDAKRKDNKKEDDKEKWYMKVLFMLNVIFFPWRISKRFAINQQIYDGILVIFVYVILGLLGMIAWVTGLFAIVNGIILLCEGAMFVQIIEMLGVGILLMMFGSFFTLAGREFSKVSDSNKIYAYSASIIALISCVITVIALVK